MWNLWSEVQLWPSAPLSLALGTLPRPRPLPEATPSLNVFAWLEVCPGARIMLPWMQDREKGVQKVAYAVMVKFT